MESQNLDGFGNLSQASQSSKRQVEADVEVLSSSSINYQESQSSNREVDSTGMDSQNLDAYGFGIFSQAVDGPGTSVHDAALEKEAAEEEEPEALVYVYNTQYFI